MGNTKRKAVEKHLILLMCLILAVGLMPSTALADESYPDVTEPVYADPGPGQTPVVDVGNVTVNANEVGYDFAIFSHSKLDADATANAHGNVSIESTDFKNVFGAQAKSSSNTATTSVTGNITASNTISEREEHSVTGVNVITIGPGTKTAIDAGGTVRATIIETDDANAILYAAGIEGYAVQGTQDQPSSSQTIVNGDVIAEALKESGETSGIAYSLDIDAGRASNYSATVKGGVTAKGKSAYGIHAQTNSSPGTNDSEMTIIVGKGGVTAESNSANGTATGIGTTGLGGIFQISIGGSVTATASGTNGTEFGIFSGLNNGITNILVEDTITARTAGVVNASKGGQHDITVWRIESDMVAGKSAGLFKYEEDEAMEKAINYIIKIEQPQEGNILSLLGTTIKEFPTLDGKHSFDVANMGQKVYLNVEEGWIITAAFNGKGDKIALEKDDQGWFVIVPNGGGVYLSAQVAKAGPAPTPTPIPSPTPAYEPGSNDEAGYLPATGDSPIAAIALAFAAAASLALALFAASRMNGRRSHS